MSSFDPEGRLQFGKHAGKTLKQLLNSKEGIDYVRWLCNSPHFTRKDVKEAAKKALLAAQL